MSARLGIFALAISWTLTAAMLHAATPFTGVPPASSSAPYVPDPVSITREGPGYRYPQSGWIVLHTEGEPYDRGYQHGKLLAAEIVENLKSIATFRSPKAPAEAWRDMRTLVGALFLRRYDAEYLEEMKGIADGAAHAGAKFENRPLDLVDIVALNSNIEVDFLDSGLEATPTGLEGRRFREPEEGQPASEPDDHCSAFAATGPATADGGIVFGHITMFHLYAVRHFNVWLDIKPKAGHRMVFQTYPGGIMSGLDYYMNDAGLLCSETTIAQTRFDAEAAPLASRIRRVMQYADSIDKAVEILTSSNNGLYSNEWLLGDTKTNEVAMFELGTRKHKLWRSSKKEFPGGTEGFYWGCNNTKDLDVRAETVASLAAKPANLVFHPANRDVAWLKLFDESRGKIDARFGFKAFTTPPLAAFRSCDAKFTTTALAKELKSWALFGPPLGRTWDAAPEELKRLSDIQPLVSNDWAMIRIDAVNEPPAQLAKAIDLAPFPKPERSETTLARGERPRVLPAAWRGTLLPASDGDIWLAAGFSDYERIVALEKLLTAKAKDHKLDREAERQLAVARYAPFSRWRAAARRLGGDVPLAEIQADWKTNEWYSVAAGKGVHLLAALRTQLGGQAFDKALDDFGRAHAGQKVSTREFREHLEKAAGQSLSSTFDPWLSGPSTTDSASENFWSVDSFEVEPERTLIVYGTLADRDTQREAAELLARKVARRFSNASFNIVRDDEVTEADLKAHHLLLVGRPAANSVTERLAAGLPVRFGAGSFVFNGETYAHANSGVIAAGPNRLNERYSAVVFAGLSASATRRVVEALPGRPGDVAEVLLLRAGHTPKAYRAERASLETAMP